MARLQLQHKHIEVFRAVMRSGSATGASRLLEITQPGVSKLLAQTEGLCGFTLFDRLHGRLVPTQRALNLFDETERMFVGMEEIARLLDRLRADEPRQVLIATVPVFAQELLPQVIARWVATDDTRLAIGARYGGNVLALVSSRRAELGLTGIVNRVPGVKTLPIDLHRQPFIASSRYEGIQVLIDRVFRNDQVRPNEIVECPLILGAAAMTLAGIGITFVDAFSARSLVPRGLQLRRFEPKISFEYRAIWSYGTRSSFDRTKFLNLVREEAQDILSQAERR